MREEGDARFSESRLNPVRTSDVRAEETPAWPPAVQWSAAGLLVVCLALVGWRGYGLSRYAPQPLSIQSAPVPIDLNNAEAVDLALLPGIGPVLSRRIVDDRAARGPFPSVDALRRVSGIGPATLERLRPHLRVTLVDPPPPSPRVVRGASPEVPVVKSAKPPLEIAIDVNTATQTELQKLPGIGPTLSARIIEKRPFRSVDELRRVRGIGAKTLEKLRPHVTVDGAAK